MLFETKHMLVPDTLPCKGDHMRIYELLRDSNKDNTAQVERNYRV